MTVFWFEQIKEKVKRKGRAKVKGNYNSYCIACLDELNWGMKIGQREDALILYNDSVYY